VASQPQMNGNAEMERLIGRVAARLELDDRD
jgi:hypothetical protein